MVGGWLGVGGVWPGVAVGDVGLVGIAGGVGGTMVGDRVGV